jgi:signal transduction histidine kinase
VNVEARGPSFGEGIVLSSLLSAHGAQVLEAENGREAMALCDSDRKFDLIILDLLLPDVDGIQVLKYIRERDDESAIVMLTGMGGIKSAIAAVQQGADGYIEKRDLSVGGDFTEFFYALQQALQHRAGLVAQKQLHKVRADFYSMVTHDLRNPASAAVLAIKLLLEGQSGSLTDEQRELLTLADSSAHQLLSLINDYLDFAKIDAGYLRLEPREAELCNVVASSAELARLQAHVKRQTLIMDLPAEPFYARVDAERLKQVLDNLISNAVKYTPDAGRITVQLRSEAGQAVLRVSDTGQGISPTELSALFTKYHRLPGEATRGIHGTGLGLLIVKEIVEAHGGSVSAASEGIPGRGATFTVRIPLERAA